MAEGLRAAGQERRAPPTASPEALARIGRELQALYETLFSEPLPDRLTALVNRLEDNAGEPSRPKFVTPRDQAA